MGVRGHRGRSGSDSVAPRKVATLAFLLHALRQARHRRLGAGIGFSPLATFTTVAPMSPISIVAEGPLAWFE